MTYLPETGEVVYRSKRNHATNRLWETFEESYQIRVADH